MESSTNEDASATSRDNGVGSSAHQVDTDVDTTKPTTTTMTTTTTSTEQEDLDPDTMAIVVDQADDGNDTAADATQSRAHQVWETFVAFVRKVIETLRRLARFTAHELELIASRLADPHSLLGRVAFRMSKSKRAHKVLDSGVIPPALVSADPALMTASEPSPASSPRDAASIGSGWCLGGSKCVDVPPDGGAHDAAAAVDTQSATTTKTSTASTSPSSTVDPVSVPVTPPPPLALPNHGSERSLLALEAEHVGHVMQLLDSLEHAQQRERNTVPVLASLAETMRTNACPTFLRERLWSHLLVGSHDVYTAVALSLSERCVPGVVRVLQHGGTAIDQLCQQVERDVRRSYASGWEPLFAAPAVRQSLVRATLSFLWLRHMDVDHEEDSADEEEAEAAEQGDPTSQSRVQQGIARAMLHMYYQGLAENLVPLYAVLLHDDWVPAMSPRRPGSDDGDDNGDDDDDDADARGQRLALDGVARHSLADWHGVESRALAMLRGLFDWLPPQWGSFERHPEAANAALLHLEALLATNGPALQARLQAEHVEVPYFAWGWILTLMLRLFPLHAACRVWDHLLVRASLQCRQAADKAVVGGAPDILDVKAPLLKPLLRLCCALVMQLEPELQRGDMGDMLQVLHASPSSLTWSPERVSALIGRSQQLREPTASCVTSIAESIALRRQQTHVDAFPMEDFVFLTCDQHEQEDESEEAEEADDM